LARALGCHAFNSSYAFVSSFVIVGMMAFLGSVGHVPLAVMVMIAEITGSYQLLAPAMIAVGLAMLSLAKYHVRESGSSPAESPAHRDNTPIHCLTG